MGSEPDQADKQRPVEFLSDGLRLRGVVRFLAGGGLRPVVVFSHGLSGLKEQTLPDAANALLDAGVAALCCEFRNTDDSNGQPDDEVAHYGRLQDWANALAYAPSLPEVDSQRVSI